MQLYLADDSIGFGKLGSCSGRKYMALRRELKTEGYWHDNLCANIKRRNDIHILLLLLVLKLTICHTLLPKVFFVFFLNLNLAVTLSSCEHFVPLGVDVEVGLFLHVAICQMRAGWQDVRPDTDLYCVIEVSSFCLCWQMDILYNVFGSNGSRQTACVQGSVGKRRWGAERQI